jgi:hypothetical protein
VTTRVPSARSSQRLEGVLVAAQLDLAAAGGVEDTRQPIAGGGEDACAVGAPLGRLHPPAVAQDHRLGRPRGAPHARRPIGGRRHHAVAVGAEDGVAHRAGVAAQDDRAAAREGPEARGAVVRPGERGTAVGAEAGAEHEAGVATQDDRLTALDRPRCARVRSCDTVRRRVPSGLKPPMEVQSVWPRSARDDDEARVPEDDHPVGRGAGQPPAVAV